MNKGITGIFAHIKRFVFVLAIIVGLMFLSGEGGGFLRILVACFCFVFAWGAWENWGTVRFEEEQETDGDRW